MSKFFHWLFHPYVQGYSSIILIRLFAGLVFLGEGILKFLYPSMGVMRFTLLGFPLPHLTANFIGIIEIVGGIFLILGLLTNLVALIFAIEMIVAFFFHKNFNATRNLSFAASSRTSAVRLLGSCA